MKTLILLLAFTLAAHPLRAETFASWIASYGLTGSNALPDADPDNDGIPNLMEYALAGLNPTAVNGTNHASMPVFGFVRRTGNALGTWEWASTTRPPTDGTGGKYHFAIKWTARAGVEGICYRPEISHGLQRWFSGRSAVVVVNLGSNVIMGTARTQGNRYTRYFMRLKVIQDARIGDALAVINSGP